jgi:hypothetical protein
MYNYLYWIFVIADSLIQLYILDFKNNTLEIFIELCNFNSTKFSHLQINQFINGLYFKHLMKHRDNVKDDIKLPSVGGGV